MAKQKSSPVHNMRLAIYALVAFVAILVIAVISMSTSYNSTAMTTDTRAASGLTCARSAVGQGRCSGNTYRKVVVYCNDGTRTFTRSYSAAGCGYLGTSSACMTQETLNQCADKICQLKQMCYTPKQPIELPNQFPKRPRPSRPTPTTNPQVCYGADDCKKMGGAGCAGYKTCNPTTHCCESVPY